MSALNKNLSKLLWLLLAALIVSSGGTTLALTQDDLNSIYGDSMWYFPNSTGQSCSSSSTTTVPAGTLPSFIPEPYNGAFTQGANAHNVSPALVAAFFTEENALGGDVHNPTTSNLAAAWANLAKSHPDPNSGWKPSSAGAEGPFQFLPSTWTGYGYNIADINNLLTSSDAAGKYAQNNSATVGANDQTIYKFAYGYGGSADWYANAILLFYHYYAGLPGNSGQGGSTTITSTTSTSCGSSCMAAATSTIDAAKTIVLDPGHAPGTDINVDPDTNLAVMDYENEPEMQQVWNVAQDMKTKLENAGYNVILTKSSLDDSSTDLKKRAETANSANAALVVSIHTTPGSKSVGNDVFIPKVGEYLMTSDNKTKVTYDNSQLAATDLVDGQAMSQALSSATSLNFKVGGYSELYGNINRDEKINGKTIYEDGNMLVSQYFAKVPWVYNEIYQDSAGASVSQSLLNKYEAGMVNGIEKIVPLGGSSTSSDASDSNSCSVSCNGGDQTMAGLSQVRQQVVCLSEQELATWKSQPGYPTTSYAAQGFLKYSDGSYEEWCADFASWIYNQAGYPFSDGLSGGWRIPGVGNIMTLGEQEQNFHWHPAGSGYVPKPGDLAIHGSNHVNIFISSSNGVAQYIGGDQGNGPNYGTKDPPSNSIVSVEQGSGYYDNGITGYVSPD